MTKRNSFTCESCLEQHLLPSHSDSSRILRKTWNAGGGVDTPEDGYATNAINVFTARDMRHEPSVVVRAINDGLGTERVIDAYLGG